MRALIIPVSKILMDKLDEIIKGFESDRVILVHSSKIGSTIDTNLRQIESYLSSKNNGLDISVQPLNCSDYPFALGESFSNWIIRDLKDNRTELFDIVISEDIAMGYFVGLTSLSLEYINLRCHLFSLTNDFTKNSAHSFNPEITYRLEQLPLFQDINKARDFFSGKKGSTRIFNMILGWHNQDRTRYNEDVWFKSKDILSFGESEGKRITQSIISKHLSIMVEMGESFRVIERNPKNETLYRITSIGRAYSWQKLSI